MIALLLLACSVPPDVQAPPAGSDPGAVAALPPVAADAILAPSPAEAQRAVVQAGIEVALADLVPRRNYKMDAPDPQVAAVRTGVVLADIVLTVHSSNDHDLLERLDQIGVGLRAMQAGAGLLSTLDDLTARTRGKTITREALLGELDALVSMSVPGAGVGPGDRTGTLLQGGAWLGTTNLVSRAILKADRVDAANTLLHQAAAAEWFLTEVRGAATGRAPEDILRALEGHLVSLRDIAARPDITRADVVAIETHTQAVLDLL